MLCVLCYERSVAVGKRRERRKSKKKCRSSQSRALRPEEWEAGTPVSRSLGRAGDHLMHTHETRRTDGGEEQLNGKLRLAQRSPSEAARSLPHPILSTLAQHLVKHSRREKECGTGERPDGPAQVRYQLSDEIIAASSLCASTVATL